MHQHLPGNDDYGVDNNVDNDVDDKVLLMLGLFLFAGS